MEDLFQRLAERTLGAAPVVRPHIRPRFAAGPKLGNSSDWLEGTDPEQQENAAPESQHISDVEAPGTIIQPPHKPPPESDPTQSPVLTVPREPEDQSVRPATVPRMKPVGYNQPGRDQDLSEEMQIPVARIDITQSRTLPRRLDKPEPTEMHTAHTLARRHHEPERKDISGGPGSIYATTRGAEESSSPWLREAALPDQSRSVAGPDTGHAQPLVEGTKEKKLPVPSSDQQAPLLPRPAHPATKSPLVAKVIGPAGDELKEGRRHEPEKAPKIHVTIGKVEVRAVMEQAVSAQRRRPSRRPPALSLEEYLAGQNKGRS